MIQNFAIQAATRCGFTFLGEYLNNKAAANDFSNPILNGLATFSLASKGVFTCDYVLKELDNSNIAKQFIHSAVLGVGVMIDDFLIQHDIFSKHHITNIASAYTMFDCMKSFMQINPIASAAIAGGLFGIKYLQEYFTGSKGLIHSTRMMQQKFNEVIENISYIDDNVDIHSELSNQNFELNAIDAVDKLYPIAGFLTLPFKVTPPAKPKILDVITLRNQEIISSSKKLLKITTSKEHLNILNEIDSLTFKVSKATEDMMEISKSITGYKNSILSSSTSFAFSNLRSLFTEVYNAYDKLNLVNKLEKLNAEAAKFKSNFVSDPRTIIERSGLDYYSNKSIDHAIEIQGLRSIIVSETGSAMLVNIVGFMENAVSLVPYYVIKGIPPYLITFAVTHILISALNTAIIPYGIQNIMHSSTSIQRLTDLYKFIEKIPNTSEVSYAHHNDKFVNGLYIKNLDVNIDAVNKIHIDDMLFEEGKWYLISGRSGCGKSTLMSALRGLPNFTEVIKISGEVYYDEDSDGTSKVYMLTQKNSFPASCTMLEGILYPMITSEVERMSYKTLVEELLLKMETLTRNSIDGQKYMKTGLLSRLNNYTSELTNEISGGQQKKLAITGMIINIMKDTGMLKIYNEQISKGVSHDDAMEYAKNSVGSVLVLIDETFNGLDSAANGDGDFSESSKGVILDTLKKSLPSKAIVLSVEHQPQMHYYDGYIHFNGDGSYTSEGVDSNHHAPNGCTVFEPFPN